MGHTVSPPLPLHALPALSHDTNHRETSLSLCHFLQEGRRFACLSAPPAQRLPARRSSTRAASPSHLVTITASGRPWLYLYICGFLRSAARAAYRGSGAPARTARALLLHYRPTSSSTRSSGVLVATRRVHIGKLAAGTRRDITNQTLASVLCISPPVRVLPAYLPLCAHLLRAPPSYDAKQNLCTLSLIAAWPLTFQPLSHRYRRAATCLPLNGI